MNLIRIYFNSFDVNGFPCIRVWADDRLVEQRQLISSCETVDVCLTTETSIRVERYGKTENNTTDELDQYLEISKITVDNIQLPEFILYKHAQFEFNDQIVRGLRFNPNGIWRFNFDQPFITWILDQKIVHESRWDQSYQYPWASKLGPDSVDTIGQAIKQAQQRVSLLP